MKEKCTTDTNETEGNSKILLIYKSIKKQDRFLN